MYWHVNPPPEQQASAPYNFVPLPARVLPATAAGWTKPPWQAHDRYLAGAHSGWIDLEIVTETPLFIRGPQRQRHGRWEEADASSRPDPWTTADGRPVIPGSSLRGMLRTLVEILTFAKLAPVTGERPFYRSFEADRIGEEYGKRMVRDGRKPAGGFLRQRDGGWVIEPATVLRVSHGQLRKLDPAFRYPPRPQPDYWPTWKLQHRRCWVVPDRRGRVLNIQLRERAGGDWQEGLLVLTGSAPKKQAEFVFLPRAGAHEVVVPDRLWRRFHDEDQLTQWQEKAFPVGQPPGASRRAAGHLRDGEPVFYLLDEQQATPENPFGLVFFGRARMFRLPYDRSPRDILGDEQPDDVLDLAEAIFGRVGERGDAIKSRVAVEDCVGDDGETDWYEPVVEPDILSSPKVTTFSHYLVQDGRLGRRDRITYLNDEQASLRGHKLYWHRWGTGGLGQVGRPNPEARPSGEMRTVIRSVKAGRTFGGRIRFENLTDVELGAVLAALELPAECRHKLGMGKPLGLGTVRITSRPHLVDRAARYASWEATGSLGEDSERIAAHCRQAFTTRVLEHAGASGEPLIDGDTGLRQVIRLEALYLLMTWEGHPPEHATRYLELDEFKARRVLPTPFRVAGRDEPRSLGEPPKPRRRESDTGTNRGQRPPRRQRPDRRHASAPAGPGGPARQPRGLTPGAQVRCQVLKTSRGNWEFAILDLPQPRRGMLLPGSPEPPGGFQHGTELQMTVDQIPRDSGLPVVLRWRP